MKECYNSLEYRRSRRAYIVQSAAEYMITLLLTDAFLAKLLLAMAMDDATIGIVSSLMNFAFMIELLVIPLATCFRSYKRFVVVVDMVSVLTYFATYLLPSFNLSPALCKILVYVLVAGGPALRCVVNSMYCFWINSFVQPQKRASFSATNEMVSLAIGILVSLSAGYLMDTFENRGNLRQGFLVFSGCILALALINLVSLLLIQDREIARQPRGKRRRVSLFNLWKTNQKYRQTVISDCLHFTAVSMTLGFLGTYKTVELGFSVWQVQIITSFTFLVRIFFSMPLGRYSDRNSFAAGYMLSQIICFVSFLLLIFTTPERRWLMVAFMLLYQIALAAFSQNRVNILFVTVSPEFFVPAMAFKNFMAGVMSLISAVAGGKILNFIQGRGNLILGLSLYGQQILATITCLLLAVTVIYDRLTIANPKTIQRSR